MSPRCPEDGHGGWQALTEAVQERILLGEAKATADTDSSLVSMLLSSPNMLAQLKPAEIRRILGELANDQATIALLESRGVEL